MPSSSPREVGFMKYVSSSQWQDAIPFETAVLAADVVPGESTRCTTCGIESALRPRDELWAFKHRHPKNHHGYVRLYCRSHIPATPRTEPAQTAARRTPARRSAPVVPERPAALCPNCFVEVPATGVCGMCGTTVA